MIDTKLKEIISAIAELRDAYVKLESILSRGPASFYFEKLGDCIDGLFLLAKFNVGNKVMLIHDIDCNNKPGWKGSEHFLKSGAIATVDEVSFSKTGFSYGIVFDHETWLDSDKVERPISAKHQFWFRESDLEHKP